MSAALMNEMQRLRDKVSELQSRNKKRDLIKQAEELDVVAFGVRCMEPGITLEEISVHIRREAERLRKQAEELK